MSIEWIEISLPKGQVYEVAPQYKASAGGFPAVYVVRNEGAIVFKAVVHDGKGDASAYSVHPGRTILVRTMDHFAINTNDGTDGLRLVRFAALQVG